MEPSEAGLRLLSYAEQIRALFQEAITAIKEDGAPKSKLRIGMMETRAGLRLPTLVAHTRRMAPLWQGLFIIMSRQISNIATLDRQLEAIW